MKAAIIISVLLVIIILYLLKILKKGRLKENSIIWFYKSLEYHLFNENPELNYVNEVSLFTVAGFLSERYKNNSGSHIDFNEIYNLARLSSIKYLNSGFGKVNNNNQIQALIYFVLLMNSAQEAKKEGVEISHENPEFISYTLSFKNEKQITKAVLSNLKQQPPIGHLALTKEFIEKNPDWYKLDIK